MIVSVKYKNDAGEYGGRAYSYYAELNRQPQVCDLVLAPVKDGEAEAMIVAVGIDPAEVAGIELKTITKFVEAAAENVSLEDLELPAAVTEAEGTLSIENAIILKQLPIIEDRLRELGERVAERVSRAVSLVCTEDTYKDIKKERAELNKEFETLEVQRKAVKSAILAPYSKFEETYKECVAEPYKAADKQLKGKIAEVEDGLKQAKEQEIREYFLEYRTSKGLDFPCFTVTRIKVNMTDSVKKLKERAKEIVDLVAKDVEAIRGMDHADEILVEYKQDFVLASAIARVTARHKAIEEEKVAEAKRMERDAARQRTAEAVQQVEQEEMKAASPAVEAPATIETPTPAKRYRTGFYVYGTLEDLKKLKAFLTEGGYEYEQL